MTNFAEIVNFIWGVADLLRGEYKPFEYRRVILPFLVIRRLDQLLEPTRKKVWNAHEQEYLRKMPVRLQERILINASGQSFYNTSRFDFKRLLADPNQIADNINDYRHGFSHNVRDILRRFRFGRQIDRLDENDLLFLITRKFNGVDLHPDRVSNIQMGYIFEELIRKFSEQDNESAGEHFTPREVIRLMVNLLFAEDDDLLHTPEIVRTMYDPACGTGGMLSVAEEYLAKLNPNARLHVYGQELNEESYAICKADMLIKGQDADRIKVGNSFSNDGLPDIQTDYLISNPPFGVNWSKVATTVNTEHKTQGHAGRFGPGLPRKNDGSLLFLLHMLSKMKRRRNGGSRLAIVFNGSPLFTGAAGSGESEIRRWVLENDFLEAIIALPDQMFYNTGISTYIWLLTNRKSAMRKGKVQLINAVTYFRKMTKSLGDKRKQLSNCHIDKLTRLYENFTTGPAVKVIDNKDFGFNRITIERPLRLSFQASQVRISCFRKHFLEGAYLARNSNQKTSKDAILAVLSALNNNRIYRSRPAFLADLQAEAKRQGVKISTPIRNAILSTLGERDKNAEICKRQDGSPKPDPTLRDREHVPLNEEIDAYMAQEVLPHAPNAWVDHKKTKVGYKIPFNHHFYESKSPRPLDVIDAEIRALNRETHLKLRELLAERRMTQITHTVTMNLEDGVSNKQERLEFGQNYGPWIGMGEIEFTRLKYLVRRVKSEAVEGACYVGLENVESWTGRYTIIDRKDATATAFRTGDVMFGKLRPYLAKSFVARQNGSCSSELLVLRPGPRIHSRFLGYVLLEQGFVRLIDGSTFGAKMPRASWDFIGNQRIPVPPLKTQQLIANFLDDKTAVIDELRNNLSIQVNRLGEYRQVLITAAVTGQLHVRRVV